MTTESTDKTKEVRTLNRLLRSEISATHTYGHAIPRVADERPRDVEVLRTIAREHDQAAQSIREVIERAGGTPDATSPTLPSFVKTVIGGPAKVFAEAAALKALKDGEEHALNDYRNALEQLNAEAGTLIRESIIPARMKNIDELSAMISRL
ncbi:MAG: DUF2383 domain-containing protein [Gemmatimonadaceae bacterium]